MLAANSTKIVPKVVGSGAWAWWSDANADDLGDNMSSLNQPVNPTVEKCLEACNDNESCAAVIVNFSNAQAAATDTVTSCQFRQGRVSIPQQGVADSTKRSMIRYRTDTTDRPATP
jgi:hypothetical protein